MAQEVVRGWTTVKQIFQFYHKFNGAVKELFEITEKQSFPVLWKFDVFMPDFHISGNTEGKDFMCNNGFTKMNIDN